MLYKHSALCATNPSVQEAGMMRNRFGNKTKDEKRAWNHNRYLARQPIRCLSQVAEGQPSLEEGRSGLRPEAGRDGQDALKRGVLRSLSLSLDFISKTFDTIFCRGLCAIGINAKLAPTPRTSAVCYFAFKRHARILLIDCERVVISASC
jgi:hypothetical protein